MRLRDSLQAAGGRVFRKAVSLYDQEYKYYRKADKYSKNIHQFQINESQKNEEKYNKAEHAEENHLASRLVRAEKPFHTPSEPSDVRKTKHPADENADREFLPLDNGRKNCKGNQ